MSIRQQQQLHIAVVEDHCDIVHFLHALVRSKRISSRDVHLLHFDSHPDMIPLVDHSVLDCYSYESLTAHLDGEMGISQFILPLLYTDQLKSAVWVKCDWADHRKEDLYTFHMGNFSKPNSHDPPKTRVTLEHSYYLDESMVEQIENLTDKKHIAFQVTDSNGNEPLLFTENWILDICLDYFSVTNPFLGELKSIAYKFETPLTSDDIWILKNIFQRPLFREDLENISEQITLSQRYEYRSLFQSFCDQLLGINDFSSADANEILSKLRSCYPKSTKCFPSSYYDKLIHDFSMLVKRMSVSVNKYIFENGNRLLLPDHYSTEEAIESDIKDLIAVFIIVICYRCIIIIIISIIYKIY